MSLILSVRLQKPVLLVQNTDLVPSSGFSHVLLFHSSQVDHFTKIDENQNEETGRDGEIDSPQV